MPGSSQTFQPTSPVRETTPDHQKFIAVLLISTHVPRAGDDGSPRPWPPPPHHFNPRPPCGRRQDQPFSILPAVEFQPTSPVLETTQPQTPTLLPCWNFNPRPPCGRRLFLRTSNPCLANFNPRPPCGRRLCFCVLVQPRQGISTHVPRAGDDLLCPDLLVDFPNFNPRPPCGRRLVLFPFVQQNIQFQPTSPVRETTTITAAPHTGQAISTHVPRAGDDVATSKRRIYMAGFQPTSPVRETTCF